jgi:hypothetical protein
MRGFRRARLGARCIAWVPSKQQRIMDARIRHSIVPRILKDMRNELEKWYA